MPDGPRVRVAVFGAGAMGRRHAEALATSGSTMLSAFVDPAPLATAVAAEFGVRRHADAETLLTQDRPDGVILATPSALHAPQAKACIEAGLPVLVEKPLATSAQQAAELVALAKAAGVPLAVGHHRRHNPIIAAAKEMLEDGRLGNLTVFHGFAWLMKPDAYFDPDWRRQPGGGPLLTNLIHDIDLMRHFCGEIVEVQALTSHATRGFAVEDSAAIAVRFASGALGTLTLSDTATAPWSWELTAAENPLYPETGQSCYHLAGTLGALELPHLRLWRNPGALGWDQPLLPDTPNVPMADPLIRQVEQFARVIRGEEPPLVSGHDGWATLQVLDAIRNSAASGQRVALDPDG